MFFANFLEDFFFVREEFGGKEYVVVAGKEDSTQVCTEHAYFVAGNAKDFFNAFSFFFCYVVAA